MSVVQPVATVVTACDHNFVWGAAILGWSMRFHGMRCPYHVLAYDLSDIDKRILESIPDTTVFPTHKADTRSVCTQKPMAIATAETEIIVWMDADCIVSGNLEKYFQCPDGKMQIRFRKAKETATVYRNYYIAEDITGSIPQHVLNKWREDVEDLPLPKIKNVCQTNCFVLNRSHLSFIHKWQTQMEKVIPANVKSVYSKDSYAYSMTDESVINSLFAFSSLAPETAEYLMDKDPLAKCIHFGMNPKPWKHWTRETLANYGYIQSLIHWATKQGFYLPEIPNSFKAQYKNWEIHRACLLSILRDIRYFLSSKIRRRIRRFR